MSLIPNLIMKYSAPLFNFWCEEEEFKITNFFSIKKATYKIKKFDDEKCLSGDEKSDIANSNFLVEINTNKPMNFSSSTILNIFLLSIWINSPTKTVMKYIFGEDDKSNHYFSRQLDRFQNNKKDNFKQRLSRGDLDKISLYVKLLQKITRNRKRLSTALFNTYCGCIAHKWQVAFVLFTAALEAMLTYSKGYGITGRLAKSYACIVETKKGKRDTCYKKFVKLYNVRSDIMHGRERKYAKAEGNLKSLSELSQLLRRLWQIILQDKNILKILEENDESRSRFFQDIENDYNKPLVSK